MTTPRQDMSEWALHFIHDYNPNAEPTDEEIDFDYYGAFPYHEDKDLNDRFDAWRISDYYYPIDPDPDALQVLLKIITDGHVRLTWAFRNSRPTIYGPRSAVCFTEMPLYALLDYAKQRRNESVTSYAVGILKRELFAAGGRAVIYGLSTKHVEQNPSPSSKARWPRKLSSACGISEAEQYRYVAMSSDPNRPIDWSHEREWRWADHEDKCSCPGLPIWLSDEPISFSRVLLVVPQSADVERVLDRLKELHDAGANDLDHLFSRKTLEATSVLALEEIEADIADADIRRLRLEDVPVSCLQDFKRPKASPELIVRVRSVLAEAQRAADQAATAHFNTAPRAADGIHLADIAGWAHLYVYDAQSDLVSALLELREAYAVPAEGYIISSVGGLGWREHQELSLAEASVKGAKAVFERNFPNVTFGMRTRWD